MVKHLPIRKLILYKQGYAPSCEVHHPAEWDSLPRETNSVIAHPRNP